MEFITQVSWILIIVYYRLILNGGCQLIAAHKARYYRSNDDCLRLGPGLFVTALEYACSTEATLIGKPSKNFFGNAIKSLGNPKIVYMIGDVSLRFSKI